MRGYGAVIAVVAAFVLTACNGAGEAKAPKRPSASSFDLLCETKKKSGAAELANAAPRHLRIDLEAMRWCEGTCSETRELVKADPVAILVQSDSDAEAGKFDDFIVKRESGRFESTRTRGNLTLNEEGLCSRAEFSGFPAQRF